MTKVHNWFNQNELINMIAISNITPGPVGINMATYSGFKTLKITGSFITTFAIILGPFILTLITIYFLNKFKNSKTLNQIFIALRPTSCALLTYVVLRLIYDNVYNLKTLNIKAFIILIILFIFYPFMKKRPSLIIFSGGILGIIFNCF